MKNTEMKNPLLNELEDDALLHVSGGNAALVLNQVVLTDTIPCPKCRCLTAGYPCRSCGWVSDDDGNLPPEITTAG